MFFFASLRPSRNRADVFLRPRSYFAPALLKEERKNQRDETYAEPDRAENEFYVELIAERKKRREAEKHAAGGKGKFQRRTRKIKRVKQRAYRRKQRGGNVHRRLRERRENQAEQRDKKTNRKRRADQRHDQHIQRQRNPRYVAEANRKNGRGKRRCGKRNR